MAIYHFRAKMVNRASGKNVVAGAAYRRATKMTDEKEGQSWDFRHKQGVIHSELLIPQNAPLWLKTLKQQEQSATESEKHHSAEALWNLVERTEKRKDAQLAREVVFALMTELTQEQNIKLASEFITDQFVLRGMVADWSVHWDHGNPHVHVLLSTRGLTELGFGNKDRSWNENTLLREWRKQWANYANFHLKLNGHDVRIDHRSYEEQGINLIPSVHQGRAVREMEKRGIPTERAAVARQINDENLERIIVNPATTVLAKVTAQCDPFTPIEIGKAMVAYVNHSPISNQQFNHRESDPPSHSGLLAAATAEDLTYPPQTSGGTFSGGEGARVEVNAQHASEIARQVMASLTSQAVSEALPERLLDAEKIAALLAKIEAHESVFTEKSIALVLNNEMSNADLFAKALLEIKTCQDVIPLGLGEDGREHFTTSHMFALENNAITLADILANTAHCPLGKRFIHTELLAYEKLTGKVLTIEQRDAVNHVLSASSISCLVGRAGTGKSFSLGAAHAVWKAKGLTVHGIALSGIAADGLARDAGMTAQTIEAFRLGLQREQIILNSKSVIVMDEAGMTDSVSLLAVLKAVVKAKAKLVLVGDPDQLLPVGPGALFRALLDRVGFVEIQTIYRQKEVWQQKATRLFAAGRIADAITAYETHGLVSFDPDAASALRHLVSDWASAHAPVAKRLVLAYRNEDVDSLNAELRKELVQAHLLAEGYRVHTSRGTVKFAQHDRLLFLKNDARLGVKNGRFATITHLEMSESGRVLTIEAELDGDQKQVVRFSPDRYREFMHGYAATVHRSQGTTFDETFVYTAGSWIRQLIYVAMSRHRHVARLYADKTHYSDLNVLKRRLSRIGLKDSIINFPKAFAERRGILLGEKQQSTLTAGLKTKLKILVNTLREKIESHLNPEYYQHKMAKLKADEVAVDGLYQRRTDAVLVANYVDTHAEVGKRWQQVQEKMAQWGIQKDDYQADAFQVLTSTEIYQASQLALAKRDRLASEILLEPARYTKALEIYGLDLTQLSKQAIMHQRRQKVEAYLTFCQEQKTVLADREALEIIKNIKHYYPLLRSHKIDPPSLRHAAIRTLRRNLFVGLSKEERERYRVVEHYCQLSKKLGAAHEEQQIAIKNGALLKRDAILRLQALANERDELAYLIANDSEHYAQALDFYQIGKATNLFSDEDVTEQQTQWATTRWYKLQSQAARYACAEKIKAYQIATQHQDIPLRQQLAHDIVQNAKAYHGTIIKMSHEPTHYWRQIRQDAKLYAREQFLHSLATDAEKAAFINVEQYIMAKRENAKAWNEIFKSQEQSEISKSVLYNDIIPALTPLFEPYTLQRDRLAATILQNIPLHAASLRFFDVGVAELNKPAYAEICRNRIKHYIALTAENAPLLPRGELAYTITREPAAYFVELKKYKVDLKTLQREANIYEKTQEATRLSKEQRQSNRLHRDYRKFNRLVGKSFAERAEIDKGTLAYVTQNERCQILLSKRDHLAHRMVAIQEKHEYAALFGESDAAPILFNLPADVQKKIVKQAESHCARVDQINAWLEKSQEATTLAKAIVNQARATVKKEWQAINQQASMIAKTIQKQLPYYRHALIESHLSESDFIRQNATHKQLASYVNTLAIADSTDEQRVVEIRKKIGKASQILKETLPIQGSLAERYLRIHRGIKGELPTTLRYHPGRYHGEANKKLPALAVVAQNARGKLRAVQLIYLDPKTANKAKLETPKMTYGSPSFENMSVVINRGKNNKLIALAEGTETALSVKEAFPELTIYCTLGTSHFHRVPLRHDTQQLLFFADNDGEQSKSQQSLYKAAESLAGKGVDVWQVISPSLPGLDKADFNDVLKRHGIVPIRESIKTAKLVKSAENRKATLNSASETIKPRAEHTPPLVVGQVIITPPQKTLSPEFAELARLITALDKLSKNPEENNHEIKLILKSLKNEVKWLKRDPAQFQQLQHEAPELAKRVQGFAKKFSRKW